MLTLKLITTVLLATATVAWTPNTEPDLEKYQLYQVHYWTAAGKKYPQLPWKATNVAFKHQSSMKIILDKRRNWMLYLTAINKDGLESAPSNIVDLPRR